MAILDIVEYPDKRLKTVAKPIEVIDDKIKTLAADMAETMYAAPGIGLAANQIGETIRILVCDTSPKDEDPMLFTLINPEIVNKEGEIEYEEGCLSVPGVYENVKRYAYIEVEYSDLEGNGMSLEAEGLLAICIQHEMDHLDGKLFVDRLSSLKRKLSLKKCDRFKAERNAKLAEGE